MSDAEAERPLAVEPGSLDPLPVDVISVQSQVVYGCVGNSVAVPALQAAGLNVIPVPTVLLSNTPHYDSLHGGAVPLEWFEGFLSDLTRRQVLRHARAVLIGYLGSPEQAEVLTSWLDRSIAIRPELKVFLDPVMGDHDSGLYVHPQLPDALRQKLVPLATGLTPNAFEFEKIVGRTLTTVEATIEAAQQLLGGRTEWVVVTSAAPEEGDGTESRIVIVTREGSEVVSWERVDSAAKGTGDLFSASVATALLNGSSLKNAVDVAHDHVVTVLERTARLNCNELVINQTAY